MKSKQADHGRAMEQKRERDNIPGKKERGERNTKAGHECDCKHANVVARGRDAERSLTEHDVS